MGLKLKSIKKSFDSKTVIDDFSYSFRDTGLYIVKGDSGSGKTTLLRIISGIDDLFDGELIGGGIQNSSFCFQEYRLFPHLSALENVTVASFDNATDEDRALALQLLLRLNFSTEDTTLRPAQLSGGMKQRVSFARAILKKSPVLLLDEPTKEVDSSIAKIMHEIITEEAATRTVILVTHKNEDISALNGEIIFLSPSEKKQDSK